MSIETDALLLDQRLRKFRWYISVGVSGETSDGLIYIYVKSTRHKELSDIRKGWMGHKVLVRQTGPIRASTVKGQVVYA